ncbi:class I SAM-dependent methyltransferase [Thiotrichales bacterium 19X7-9]|nr:class I SAM-dependent methyltransferase [Thiotrichales bacterium 19X7-9]
MTNTKNQYYNQPHDISAYKAKFEALKIAFSPMIFQVSIALVELGILQKLSDAGEVGLSVKEIAKSLKLSDYGVGVLLDAALSAHIVWLDEKNNHYILDKIGIMLLSDQMVRVNLDFNQYLCYEGLFHLTESIKTGKAKGLKVFDETASSIYPLLTKLPEKAQKSWFNFDHYYSDKSFKALLPMIFKTNNKPKTLLDIGGNTGKWAIECLKYDKDVIVTIADLEAQLAVANNNIKNHGFEKRFSSFAVNLLDPQVELPSNYTFDLIWMSQFLDCFSLEEIKIILTKIVEIMTENTKLGILELFWDRQIFEPAAFAINCTSIYFTALANGNSRMYHSKDLINIIHEVGLYIDYDEDAIGPGHTLLICKKKG